MERVLHEVALVAAARLQAQHAVARGARQRAARQVLTRHVLRGQSPCISDPVLALIRDYRLQRLKLRSALPGDAQCLRATCVHSLSAAHLHTDAPAALDPAVLSICARRIHAHVQEGCVRIRHHKQSSAAPGQTPSFLLPRQQRHMQDITSSAWILLAPLTDGHGCTQHLRGAPTL